MLLKQITLAGIIVFSILWYSRILIYCLRTCPWGSQWQEFSRLKRRRKNVKTILATNKNTNVFFFPFLLAWVNAKYKELKTVERLALCSGSFVSGPKHICVREILALLETPPHTSHCEYVILLCARACQSFISFEILPRIKLCLLK